jgi:CRP/FNR family cyclic AMP-dependent transcriptional regulator
MEVHMSKLEKINAGAVLYSQGDQSDAMYILRSGQMALYLDFGTPDQFELINIGPGSCMGEMGLLEKEPRNATAVALVDSEVEKVQASELGDFIRSSPEVIHAMIIGLARRLRNVTVELMSAHSVIKEVIEQIDEKPHQLSFREKLNKYSDLLFGLPKDVPPDLYVNLFSRMHGSMY